MSDLAEMATQKKNNQQMNQLQQNSEGLIYNANEVGEDSQDLKTPTAENQQTLIEHKVITPLPCVFLEISKFNNPY